MYQKCKELFEYKEGLLIYKKKPKNSRIKIGDIAGCINNRGYLVVRVSDKGKSKLMKVHRIIYFLCKGVIPNVIDHKDGNKLNNNIDNLVDTDARGNASNLSCHRQGKKIGYTYDRRRDKWVAQVWFNKKNYNLGSFLTEEEASTAYALAVNKLRRACGKSNW